MKAILITFFFTVLYLFSSAQICDGNLGENIFDDGDFGSGQANVLQVDPLLAPGYQYTTNPPPLDGVYTITNNTGSWAGGFDSWLDIPDNSNNPLGYMMVINASFDTGLFYEQEVNDLCDNTLYEFSADVINLIRQSIPDHIKPNVSFLIDGVVQYSTGEIDQTEQWNTYGFTFVTDPGQTSIVLSLRNNAPGGIGNDLAIDNIAFRPCGPMAQILPEEVEIICEDGAPTELVATVTGNQYDNPAFQWQQSFNQGQTWVDIPGANNDTYIHTDLSSGSYFYRYLIASEPGNLANSKCRIVSNLKIIEVIPKFYTTVDTLCEGLTYTNGTSTYTTTGIYVDSLISSIGCDSIVTTDLTFVADQGIVAMFSTITPQCFGVAEGSIFIDTVYNGYAPYTYSLDDGIEVNTPTFENLPPGIYDLMIEDVYGCTYETIIDIDQPDVFLIELGNDQSVNLGESIFLTPFANDDIQSFSWIPDVDNCEIDCCEVEFTPINSSIYTINAISDDGCIATDSIFIEVIKNRNVFIPNVFTPNFDGVNDFFFPFSDAVGVQSITRFQVFNRWGAIVYDGNNLDPFESNQGWNGRFKGKDANVGVYAYIVEITFLDGEALRYTGDVLLVK